MTRSLAAASCLLASMSLEGCFLWTSAATGSELEESVDQHDERLEALESGSESEREQLKAAVARAQQKVAELEGVLKDATEVVRRNSADVGVEVQELRTQVASLQGRIAELEQQLQSTKDQLAEQQRGLDERLTNVARRAGVEVPLDASEVPADRTDHYTAAYNAFQAGEYGKSRALFREFVRRYSEDDQADNAQYWVAESYAKQEKPATALAEFNKVREQYARGDAVDEALLGMANAFYELHACDDAKSTLEVMIRTHARSRLVGEARQLLRKVKRSPRSYCTR